MKENNRSWVKKNILALATAFIFISPVLFFNGESVIIYILISGFFGFFAGKELKANIEGVYSKYNNKGFLSRFAILIYLLVYVFFFVFIEIKSGRFFVEDKLSFLLMLFFGTLLLYVGLVGLKTKRIFMRTFLYTGVGAIFFSVIQIIGSIFILLIPIIFK